MGLFHRLKKVVKADLVLWVYAHLFKDLT